MAGGAPRWWPRLLPGLRRGHLDPAAAYARLPTVDAVGPAPTRTASLAEPWTEAVALGRPGAELADFEALVDAAVSRYARWAPAEPTMLVHMATAPRAVSLIVPSLPAGWWPQAYDEAWRVSAALASMYRPTGEQPLPTRSTGDPAEAALAAADCGDEHAIKLTEVALESPARGNPDALTAAALATELAG